MKFIKMHALGNDFVLIHRAELHNHVKWRDIIKSLSNRHTGIGFDQAIIIDDFDATSDFCNITFLNADGSHAGGCGNGTRAAAGYYHKETGKKEFNIHIALPNGGVDIVTATIIPPNIPYSITDGLDGMVQIKMPSPRFGALQIPLSDKNLNPQALKINDFTGFCVNVGNPHYVMILDNYDEFLNFPLEGIGSYIEHHALFPERINVEILFIQDRKEIAMRVWERGTGITQACGTGACASVVAAVRQGLVDNKCTVIMDGGSLEIEYTPAENSLYMTGDYVFVFEGNLL